MKNSLEDLLNERALTKKKYNMFNKVMLILSLILFAISFMSITNKNLKVFSICEFVILLELILFSILAFSFRLKDNIIINYLNENLTKLNIDTLVEYLSIGSRKRKSLDLLGKIILIVALLIFMVGIFIKIKTGINLFFTIKNIMLLLFFLMSFGEWKYSKLIDKTISIVE